VKGAVTAALVSALVVAATTHAAPPPPAPEGTAPQGIVIDVAAVKRSIADSRGRVLVVHFWATWCPPCLDELPMVSKFAAEMKPRGVDVLSLSLDDPQKSAQRVRKLLDEQAPNLTARIVNVDDPDAFINAIDLRWQGAIPALFAYDATGRLRGSHVGEASRRDLDRLVGRALKAPPPPEKKK
jgi:thiol-disulfide isomerase/thioredoxin